MLTIIIGAAASGKTSYGKRMESCDKNTIHVDVDLFIKQKTEGRAPYKGFLLYTKNNHYLQDSLIMHISLLLKTKNVVVTGAIRSATLISRLTALSHACKLLFIYPENIPKYRAAIEKRLAIDAENIQKGVEYAMTMHGIWERLRHMNVKYRDVLNKSQSYFRALDKLILCLFQNAQLDGKYGRKIARHKPVLICNSYG